MTTEKILSLVLDHASAIQAGNLHKSRAAYAARREALEAHELEVADMLTISHMQGHSQGVADALKRAPEGWRMVPVEPTQEMMKAAVIFANGNAVYKNVAAEALQIEESIYGEAYSAMIEAAPDQHRS
jgi:hypothetical protein